MLGKRPSAIKGGHRATYMCANYTNEYLFNYRVKPQPATGQRNEDRGWPRSDMDNSVLAPTWPHFLSLHVCRAVSLNFFTCHIHNAATSLLMSPGNLPLGQEWHMKNCRRSPVGVIACRERPVIQLPSQSTWPTWHCSQVAFSACQIQIVHYIRLADWFSLDSLYTS